MSDFHNFFFMVKYGFSLNSSICTYFLLLSVCSCEQDPIVTPMVFRAQCCHCNNRAPCRQFHNANIYPPQKHTFKTDSCITSHPKLIVISFSTVFLWFSIGITCVNFQITCLIVCVIPLFGTADWGRTRSFSWRHNRTSITDVLSYATKPHAGRIGFAVGRN